MNDADVASLWSGARLLFLMIIFSHILGANAQDQQSLREDVAVPASPQDSLEKIEITGSRIKRIDVEGPSPVMTLDREFLDKSGYNSVADVLRDSSVSSFGVEREYADETNSVGAATVGLRGFGADKTLILLDGRRLPKIDGGNSVDLNLIPMAAIERIEILKDGASAIYGSDALAGVINFITKKNFAGRSVQIRHSQPEETGGVRQDLSATLGQSWAKGNVLAIYQYRNNHRLMDRDRDWSRGAVSTYSSPPSQRVSKPGAKWQAAAACPEDRIRTESDGSSFCTFDYSVYTTSLPDTEQHSAMLRGDYEVNANLTAFATTTFTRRQTRWQWAPSADDFRDFGNVDGPNYKIPRDIARKGGVTTDEDVELQYRTVNELGARASRDTANAIGAAAGLQGYLTENWEWEVSANHGFSELNNLRHAGYGNTELIFNKVKSGELNLFKASNAPDDSLRAIGSQFIRTKVTTTQLTTTGELGQALGANLTMANGVASAWESYEVTVDDVTASGNLWGGIGESGRGNRNFQSLFSELGLNYQYVELNLAGRFDNYSDFGSTLNPKFAVRVQPLKSLIFRGSAGTGFRAPSLDELYSASSYGYPWFTDQIACDQIGGTYCEERQYRVFSGGNRDLQQETSVSANVGTVFQPNQSLSMSVDYWRTDVKNAVGLDLNDLMAAEKLLGRDAIAAQGVIINRDANNVMIDIFAPNLNLARQSSEGVEFSLGSLARIGPFDFRPRIDHSQLLRREEEVFPGLGFRNKLGERGNPAWKNTASLTMSTRSHSARVAARTIAGQYKARHLSDPTFTSRLPNYTEYDIHYDYLTDWQAIFSFGVKNLLGSDRPLDDSAGFANRFNPMLYDQIGRLAYLGYSQDF